MAFEMLKAGTASLIVIGGTLLLFQPASANARPGSTSVESQVYGRGETVTGSGRVIEQARPVSNAVRRVIVEDASDLVIRQGAPALTVSSDDNIIDMVSTEVRGDTLRIASRGSYRTRKGVRSVLTIPDLDAVTVEGSGDVRFAGWRGDALLLQVDGSGDIDLAGSVGRIEARVRGSGDIDLREARTSFLDAEVAGSGDIRTGSAERVSARVYGSGDIHVSGTPEMVSPSVYGSGAIRGGR